MTKAVGLRPFEISDYKERAQKILQLIEAGYCREAMAERFGCSEKEVNRMLTDARNERRRKELS